MKLKGKDLDYISSGSTFKAIRRNDFDKFKILLPSLREQERIAELLRTVDEAIQKANEKINKT